MKFDNWIIWAVKFCDQTGLGTKLTYIFIFLTILCLCVLFIPHQKLKIQEILSIKYNFKFINILLTEISYTTI